MVPKKKTTKKKKITGGAKEAVTGYDFQFIWTARRCLSMLRHDSSIIQVNIEGLDYQDEMDFGQGVERFLGVDMSEYYGGAPFSKAEKVVISQLKCGISHPNKNWTISRICQKKRTKRSSVVGRLASDFQSIYNNENIYDIIKKLRLQIVSNSPLASKAEELVRKAQSWLNKSNAKPEKWQFAKLKKTSFSKPQISDLDKLYVASGLTSNAFCVFLSCLDFSKFNVESPILQRRQLEEELRVFDRAQNEDALLKLCDQIRELAKKGGGKITSDDVLSCFNTSKDNLFPAPCLIKTPQFIVETDDCRNLAKLVLKSSTRKIIAHGEAGVGKSLTMKTLQNYLPEGSVSVVYDCYAGGSTETPDKYRFPDTVLCTQLVNELSLEIGQNIYLIRNRTDQMDAWRTLQFAIDKAAEELWKNNAYLVLIVDAADNAIESYNRHKDRRNYESFIPILWNITLPQNARLICTCRTFRKSKLNIPEEANDFELKGFDNTNSLDYLRNHFPKVDDRIGEEFHEKTLGVPRHQNYWLAELSTKKQKDAFDEIRQRKAFGLSTLYNDWLVQAKTALPSKVPCKKIIGLLRVAANPISLLVISNCLGVDVSDTLQFCQGLGPGIMLNNQEDFQFRDEDYEAFLDKMLGESDIKAANDTLAYYCYQTIEKEIYSSKYACLHLFNSGRHEDLLAIVLGRSGIDTIPDTIEQTNYEQDRIRLAFKSASLTKNPVSALKLLFETGRVNRTDSVLTDTMVKYPELFIHHNSYKTLEKNLLESDQNEKGKSSFRIAAHLSNLTDKKNIAKSNLKKGESWLRVHITEVKKNKWGRLEYDLQDSSFQAIAALNIYGPSSAGQVLRCWVSPEYKLESIYIFFKQLSTKYDANYVKRVYSKCPSLVLARAAAIAGMYEFGIKPKKTEIKYVAYRLSKWLAKYSTKYQIIRHWILSFLELSVKTGVDHNIILEIINNLQITNNEKIFHRVSVYDWMEKNDKYARFTALKSMVAGNKFGIEEVFPEDVEKIKSHRNMGYSNDDKAITQIKSIIPIYEFRAEAFKGNFSVARISKKLNEFIDAWATEIRGHWDRREPLYEVFVLNAIDLLIKSQGVDTTLINKILEPCEKIMGYEPPHLYISVAEMLSFHDPYKDIAYELIGKVKSEYCKSDIRASEVVDRLMKCSEILMRIDKEQSKTFFDDAIKAASGIDDDASLYLKAIANLSEQCIGETSHEMRTMIASKLRGMIENYWAIMEDEERIPWDDYVRSMAALDSNVGLEAIYDMDEKGWIYIPRESSGIASGLLIGSQIDSVYSLAFHEFGMYGTKYLENSLHVLQEIHDNDPSHGIMLFEKLAIDVTRDSQLSDRGELCERLFDWGKCHNMPKEITSKIAESRDFYSIRENWIESDGYQNYDNQSKNVLKKKWQKKITSNVNKMKLIDGMLAEKDFSETEFRSLINELANMIRGTLRVDFLNRLSNYKSDISYYSRKAIPELINEFILEWTDTPGVTEWARTNIPRYISEHYIELLGYSYDYSLPKCVIDLIENKVFSEGERANVLLPMIAEQGYSFSPRLAYKMAGVLGRYLPERNISTSIIKILSNHEKDDQKPDDRVGITLSEFLYKCFEQPDNRMRWRTFHAVRHMLYSKPEPLLTELVNMSFSQKGQMWMSAREWLMFLFLHIAHKHPETLVSYAPQIYKHASDEDFPHAGIQELAKKTLLKLSDFDSSILTADQIKHLELLNEPIDTYWPKGDRYNSSWRDPKKKSARVFDFDTTDTFPYWYSPLGRCFALHRCDVGDRADRWISKVWGISSNDCRMYSRKKNRGEDWNLYSHRHGSHPIIENLSRYVERHAMHMAAGEMIRELPVMGTDDYDYCKWSNWIARNSFDADPIITSDLRNPIPLSPFFHGVTDTPITKDSHLSSTLFAEQIYGKLIGNDSNWIVASGYYTVVISDLSVGVTIQSGLVTPRTAKSLARAMLSIENLQSINIPEPEISCEYPLEDIEAQMEVIDKSEDVWERTIKAEDFMLEPFTIYYHTEHRMHEMDPNKNGSSSNWHIPCKDFIEKQKLIRVPEGLAYIDKKRSPIAIPESWEEGDSTQRFDHRTTYGNRLIIKKDAIDEYLQQVGKDLLVRVIVRRNNYHRDNTEKYDNGQGKIFIIRQNGRIEAMGRNS